MSWPQANVPQICPARELNSRLVRKTSNSTEELNLDIIMAVGFGHLGLTAKESSQMVCDALGFQRYGLGILSRPRGCNPMNQTNWRSHFKSSLVPCFRGAKGLNLQGDHFLSDRKNPCRGFQTPRPRPTHTHTQTQTRKQTHPHKHTRAQLLTHANTSPSTSTSTNTNTNTNTHPHSHTATHLNPTRGWTKFE